MNKPSKSHYSIAVYCGFLGLTCIAGLAPAALTFAIDPYEAFDNTRHSKTDRELAEKSHYPLWKFTHYSGQADTVILGDSRARALRDKYWHEFGATQAYNFAYGGGTIPEIHATFRQIKNNPNLKHLVVGIQLRSFDENHKGGLNRVPEAITATASHVNYLKNWFVARKSWEFFVRKNPKLVSTANTLTPSLIPAAHASDLGRPGTTEIKTLLLPDVCFGCDLPEYDSSEFVWRSKGPNLGLGRGKHFDLWSTSRTGSVRVLPAKFERQVTKNARSDWKTFRFSRRYFAMMSEMADWADADPERSLIFVIPPTIVEMQRTIADYGLAAMNLSLRRRLAGLAPVIDFDFANPVTRDLSNFSDAYHFNSKLARLIVGEVLMMQGANSIQAQRVAKRRSKLTCPSDFANAVPTADAPGDYWQGKACRIWTGAKK